MNELFFAAETVGLFKHRIEHQSTFQPNNHNRDLDKKRAELITAQFSADRVWARKLLNEQNAALRMQMAIEISEQENQFCVFGRERKATNLPKKALAFDLGHERQIIEKYIAAGQNPDKYWDFFEKQVYFFANEAYGKVERICYETDIVQGQLGEDRLFIGPMGVSARQSYIQPLARAIGTNWEQDRAAREFSGIVQLEQLMNSFPDGTVFFDISPAPFEVLESEKADTMYGDHSFLRINQVVTKVDEKGAPQRKLISRAIRNYLTLDRQTELFQILSGKRCAPSELLGTFAILQPKFDITDVQNDANCIALKTLIQQLIDKTPHDQRLNPQNDPFFATAQTMEQYFAELKPMLQDIFADLRKGPKMGESSMDWEIRVASAFQTYEKMIQARIKGEWRPNNHHNVENERETVDSTVAAARRAHTQTMRAAAVYYAQIPYTPPTSSCGMGSGFGGMRGAFPSRTTVFGGMRGYARMSQPFPGSFKFREKTKNKYKYEFNKKGVCKKCKKPNSEVGLLGPCYVCRTCQNKYDSGEYKET